MSTFVCRIFKYALLCQVSMFQDPRLFHKACKHLTRRDIVQWSRCSKLLHEALKYECEPQLTEKQAEVVEHLLSLNGVDYQLRKNRPGNMVYGAKYSVGTGTCTGKTLTMLYFAKKVLGRGDQPLIVVNTRFLQHIKFEHAKFAQRLRLPPLVIAHSYTQPKWQSEWREGCITLAPMSVMSARKYDQGERRQPGTVRADKSRLVEMQWDVCIVDEGSTVPSSVRFEIGRDNPTYFAVNFNANIASECADYIADAELGDLPHVSVDMCTEHIRPRGQRGVIEAGMWCEEIAAYMSERIAKLRGKKTIVLSDDFWRVRGNNIVGAPSVQKSIVRLWSPEGTTHTFHGESGSVKKQKVIASFAACGSGLLWAPQAYVARGFNLHCDTLICFNLSSDRSAELYEQLVGRIRRVDAPARHVRMFIFTRPPRFRYYAGNFRNLAEFRFINFAVLFSALNSKEKRGVARIAHEEMRTCVLNEGHRRRLHGGRGGRAHADDYTGFEEQFDNFIRWFVEHYEAPSKHISYAAPGRVIITSDPEYSYVPQEFEHEIG